MEFNEHGNINGNGIYRITKAEFKNFFVDNLENFDKRNEIFENFIGLINSQLLKPHSGQFTRIWCDGSFCTNKEMPNDIDFVILFNANSSNINHSNSIINAMADYKFHDLAKQFKCDLYTILDTETFSNDEEYPSDFLEVKHLLIQNFQYWNTFFLSDRMDRPKPMFEMRFEGGELI